MPNNPNECPICLTEYSNQEQQQTAKKTLDQYNKKYFQLKQENKHLETLVKELNQTIEELKEKLNQYEPSHTPEDKWNDVADDSEIEELLKRLKHPLVVEAIKNIIHDCSLETNNQFVVNTIPEPIPNQSWVTIKDENSNNTTIDETENNSQENIQIGYDINLTRQEEEVVNKYKNQNRDLRRSSTEVSEAPESQNKRWSGSKEATIFQKDRQGNYWIITIDECFYIVPQSKFKINEHNQDTLKSAFDCRGYKSGISDEFTLVKPGKVSSINLDEWQLIERGILQFEP